MKLSIIGPVYPYRGGISTYTSELCQRLISSGHALQVMTYKRMYPKLLYRGRSITDDSLPVLGKDPLRVIDPYNAASWGSAADVIIDFQPDLVVLEWWVTFWAWSYRSIIKSLRKAQIPLIFQIHNVLPHEKAWFDKMMARYTLSQADGYLLHSEREKLKLFHLLGTQNLQFRIKPLPLLPPQPGERMEPGPAKSLLDLPENAKVILFFGIVRQYKGLSHLLEAAARIIIDHPEVHLVIAGEFWEDVQKYHSQAGTLGIEEHIHIFNRYIPNNQVGQYFSAADVYVAPYLAGSQSGAMKIAMGYGLPIVVSDSIVDELIQYPKEYFAKYHAGDVDGMVEALRRMMSMQQRPAVDRLANQSWQDIIDAILDLHHQIRTTKQGGR